MTYAHTVAGRHTPARLRRATFVVALLIVECAVLLTVTAAWAHAGTARIADAEAPVVVTANDLYFALNDMDAQLANVLLTDGSSLFEQRRMQADADVDRLAAAHTSVTGLLDALGRYEALAATALLLHQQHATAPALDAYRSATALLRTTLLVRAQDVVNEQTRRLNADYRTQRHWTTIALVALAAVGVSLIVLLVWLQLFLSRRFRRTLNPAVLAASAVVLVLLGGGVTVLGQHIQRLHTAKEDAFDSVVALTQARAVSYDANADESRYLLDPRDAAAYQRSFQDKTQQILDEFGTEFGNITFAGERAAADSAFARFQAYQAIDREIRRLATTGQRPAAIALCTSYAPGGSNYAFEQYATALSGVTAINTRAFGSATHADRGTLSWWTWLPGALAVAALLLLAAGVRLRLAEYR